MAFKRRGTGRDEMLKRNMERMAKRRRDRKNKPEKKKEELKVNKEEAPKFPPLTAPPTAYPDAPPPVPKEPKQPKEPESQNEQVETPPVSPRENQFADLQGGGGDPKETSYRYVAPKSNIGPVTQKLLDKIKALLSGRRQRSDSSKGRTRR